MKDAIEKVGDDIRNAFNKKGSITSAEYMTLCKDVMKLGVQTIRGLTTSLLKLVKMLLEKISKYGNASIDIPIFSSIYKTIAKHDLTVFDAISLIIAIPTTIFMKIITGNKPPTLPGLDAARLGQIVLGTEPKIDAQTQLDFNILTSGISVSGVLVLSIVQVVKLAYKSATAGMEGALDTFKSAGGFLELFSIVIDMIGVLHAMPTDPTLPGLKYREWVSC
jgi:hypothetical protein